MVTQLVRVTSSRVVVAQNLGVMIFGNALDLVWREPFAPRRQPQHPETVGIAGIVSRSTATSGLTPL
jgi:hypothetical protein